MRLLRREFEVIGRRIHGKPRRTRVELKSRGADIAVEAGIFEQHLGRTEQLTGADAATRAAFATHLEQIGEIAAEQQREIENRGVLTVVLHADALVGRASPKEDRAHDVQHVFLKHVTPLTIDVWIGQVHRERGIVIAKI